VANARELEAVTGRSHRSDHHDARQLARLARVDTALLNPVELRRTVEQADLFVIRARAALVEARTMLINFARGITKTMRHRLPSSTSHCFAERVRAAVPEALHPALLPLLAVLKQMEAQIEDYDDKIEKLAAEQYPETRWLQQVPGVGTLTSLTFALTVGQPERFAHSRDVERFWDWFHSAGRAASKIRTCLSANAVTDTSGVCCAVRACLDEPFWSGLLVAAMGAPTRAKQPHYEKAYGGGGGAKTCRVAAPVVASARSISAVPQGGVRRGFAVR
jgi:hypothetical protein